jgi:hypothetical protein
MPGAGGFSTGPRRMGDAPLCAGAAKQGNPAIRETVTNVSCFFNDMNAKPGFRASQCQKIKNI